MTELETIMPSIWLDVSDLKSLRDWEHNLDPNQTSGTPLDVRQKIIDIFLECAERQWDIDYISEEERDRND
tara:strand:+ start:441 stop:653 length:213 start_codon:yes stop_codon:yes gene_type:complete